MSPPLVRVALPLPVPTPYLYRVPETLADRALPGARVVVPVRAREMVGIVTGPIEDGAEVPTTVREILAAPDAEPALPGPLLALARDIARHYGAPPGLVIRAMLPAALWGQSQVVARRTDVAMPTIGGPAGQLLDALEARGGEAATSVLAKALKRPAWDILARLVRAGAVVLETVAPDTSGAVRTERTAVLVGEPIPLLERDRRFGRSAKQRRLYEVLEGRGGRLAVHTLLAAAEASDAPLAKLVEAGLVRVEKTEAPRDPFAAIAGSAPPESLTDAQHDALAALEEVPPGESAILFGVTGSGKTLVYIERIRALLASGRGAILLVPEIGLTPQTVARLRGAFGDDIAVLHSGLSDGERADAWRALRRGERRVAVGARSAIFAPVRDLGLIVLDEEHEATYKNSETPRYHAREVAAMRARHEGATVILGSATPSLESWERHVATGRVVRLPDRVGMRPMPPVELVDLRTAALAAPGLGLPWTERLEAAVTGALAKGDQVLLLLNRRGWAAFVQCTSCGTVVECPHCSISLTVHRHPDELRCHYCNLAAPIPPHCLSCDGETIRHLGAGTQQLERLVAERFPTARVARMDLDTTASRFAHHRILERVARREVDILLGTQMIAKGIDFPDVTVVGVVDADTALHLPDFRAAERTFQLIAQVAGRAGRGPKGGKVLVQTRQPEHPALQFAARHDAEGFLAHERAQRESPAYPPLTGLVRVVISGEDPARVEERAAAFATWCEGVLAKAGLPVIVLGPAPAPIARIQGRWRHHVLLKGPKGALGRWVRTAGPRLGASRDDVRISVDRDPVSLL